jgi:hypothetical protein
VILRTGKSLQIENLELKYFEIIFTVLSKLLHKDLNQ